MTLARSTLACAGTAVLAALLFFAWRAPEPRPRSRNILDNALATHNGGPLNDLAAAALTSSAATNHPTFGALIEDPGTREFVKYLLECAFSETTTISVRTPSGNVYEFHGALNLAPEWAEGPCEEACQEWVSACLYARTNYYGVAVRLYFDGEHPTFTDNDEPGAGEEGYTIHEGAFYGNYFLDPSRYYACRGPDNDPLHLNFRVCTRPGSLCGIQHVGPCGEIDGETGLPSDRHACGVVNERGIYTECRNRATIPGTNEFPEPSKNYTRVINTFLRPTSFSDGKRATDCPAREIPDAGLSGIRDAGFVGSTAGARCLGDDDCASEKLSCDLGSPNPICSGPCQSSARQDYEQFDCDGEGSTCLSVGTVRICTHACTPGQGDCQRGQTCTGMWLQNAEPDRPGCYPYCASDADCLNGQPCDPRSGACGFTTNLNGLPDGMPCTQDQVCRGACFTLVETSSVGVCGSFLNRAATDVCPDEPGLIMPFGPADDELAVCACRRCRTSADCTSPLQCLIGPMGELVCTLQ